MTARMRRLASDWEQIKKDFTGHKNIIVTPVGDEPPEKYRVTFFVNGIYLLPDGRIETLGRHEVEITLHADYPRYKPICKILTPIWHPNFRDGQICIGNIWGAGESLSDIIVNIGNMIQYRSWNSYSPLSADAAQWAMENKHLFPVGNIDLYMADYASAKDTVEIDLFDDFEEAEPAAEAVPEAPVQTAAAPAAPAAPVPVQPAPTPKADENDFEITVEELAGIEFIPTAQRMQTVSHGGTVKGGKVNFKTVLVKGLLWALIGAFSGFLFSELSDKVFTDSAIAEMYGYSYLAQYYEYNEIADEEFAKGYDEYLNYCKRKGLNPDDTDNLSYWLQYEASAKAERHLDAYSEYDTLRDEALYDSYEYEFGSDEDALGDGIAKTQRTGTAIWSGIIALCIGLFLGIGEGVFYGSKEKTLKYALLGAGVSIVIGTVSGYLAQWMYSEMLGDDPAAFTAAFIRGIGWVFMGLGIGIAAGLIKPEKKSILFCALGGGCGTFCTRCASCSARLLPDQSQLFLWKSPVHRLSILPRTGSGCGWSDWYQVRVLHGKIQRAEIPE